MGRKGGWEDIVDSRKSAGKKRKESIKSSSPSINVSADNSNGPDVCETSTPNKKKKVNNTKKRKKVV